MSKPILPPDLLRKLADFERRIQAMERRPDTPFREVPAGEVSGTIDVPLLHTDGNVLIVATLTGDTTFNIQGLRSDVYFTFLLTQDEVGDWDVGFSPTPTTPRNDPLPMGTLPGDLNYIIGVGTDETHFFAFLGGGPILPQSGHRIYDELDPVFQRQKLSFRGEGVMVFDEPGSLSTIVQMASASGGSSRHLIEVLDFSLPGFVQEFPDRGKLLISGGLQVADAEPYFPDATLLSGELPFVVYGHFNSGFTVDTLTDVATEIGSVQIALSGYAISSQPGGVVTITARGPVQVDLFMTIAEDFSGGTGFSIPAPFVSEFGTAFNVTPLSTSGFSTRSPLFSNDGGAELMGWWGVGFGTDSLPVSFQFVDPVLAGTNIFSTTMYMVGNT